MRIRLKGPYAGIVVEHSPHVAHELISRGLAEAVDEPVAAPVPLPVPVVETAEAPQPEPEKAVKRQPQRKKWGRR